MPLPLTSGLAGSRVRRRNGVRAASPPSPAARAPAAPCSMWRTRLRRRPSTPRRCGTASLLGTVPAQCRVRAQLAAFVPAGDVGQPIALGYRVGVVHSAAAQVGQLIGGRLTGCRGAAALVVVVLGVGWPQVGVCQLAALVQRVFCLSRRRRRRAGFTTRTARAGRGLLRVTRSKPEVVIVVVGELVVLKVAQVLHVGGRLGDGIPGAVLSIAAGVLRLAVAPLLRSAGCRPLGQCPAARPWAANHGALPPTPATGPALFGLPCLPSARRL